MSSNFEADRKTTKEHDGNFQHIRFDISSSLSTSSAMVLSSCSSEDEKDENNLTPKLKWKRQKILKNDYVTTERPSSNSERINSSSTDRSLVVSGKENEALSLDEDLRSMPPRRLPPIPEDKLHRRNPHTVRQEIKMFDGIIPETTLADVELNDMPGVHNTEQWKRIAGRVVQASPPLSRQYYQTVISTIDSEDGQIPQPLGSYRRPGRSENEEEEGGGAGGDTNRLALWRTPRRRIFFGSSIAVLVLAVVVAVILAVTLVQKSGKTTTDYYYGSVYVNAKFEDILFDPTSSLARSYRRQLCTLIGTILADTKTKYALFYSTCSVLGYRDGSIIADFVLGFTRHQNVTRLHVFLNRSLANRDLFGGTILYVTFNGSFFNLDNSNNTNTTDYYYDDADADADPENYRNLIMTEQNLTNDQTEPTRTTYTTVTYTKLDKGLSITISETITITNNSLDKSPINNKNYELILVPTIENSKTIVVPNTTNEKSIQVQSLPPPPTTTTTATNIEIKSPLKHNYIRPIKSTNDPNFAYIDESSDDRTYSSGDVSSTLEDLTTRDSTTTNSTISLNDPTLINSTATLINNPPLPSLPPPPLQTLTPKESKLHLIPKSRTENNEDENLSSTRFNPNVTKRQRRMVIPKNQRRLLQYELMPTGKVYYVDRPSYYNDNKQLKETNDDTSSAILSTILSRSSSLDTLSDKHYRHKQQFHRKPYHDLTIKKSEQKLSVGGRLASNNNLFTPTSTTFKPINTNKKKRFSSFEPTPESLDRVFDVLIAADKRREEHEFWKKKFDQRQPTSSSFSTRIPNSTTNRLHDTTNSNTIPFHRIKPTQLTSNPTDNRSQSYTNKRSSYYDTYNQQSGCLLEDCLKRRTFVLQKQAQRNYSPNTIYSTNYPKQQLSVTTKPPLPTTTSNQQPVRILPLSNGRIGRAPQARQTSDELTSTSDVWAARSSLEDDHHHPKKSSSNHARFQSAVNRKRIADEKSSNINKRASSVEQQKSHRTQTKNSSTSKNKFFDLFKFNR